MAFVKVAFAKLLIPLNLSIVLKVVLDVQERALNHGIQISLKTKSGFGVFPLPLPSWTVRFHFPPHSPTTAAVAEKLKIFFSIFFPNGANVGAEVTFRISFRHLENFG